MTSDKTTEVFQIDIVLDREDRTYLVGEQVSGCINVEVSADLECEELSVTMGTRVSPGVFHMEHESRNSSAFVLFIGPWKAGRYQYLFDFVIDDDRPTFAGKLFSIDKMVIARADIRSHPTVVKSSGVSIANRQQFESWYDPNADERRPYTSAASMKIVGAPVRWSNLKSAATRFFGTFSQDAKVTISTPVIAGGETLTVTVSEAGGSKRLRRLRACLSGEEWKAPERTDTDHVEVHRFYSSTIDPQVQTTETTTEVTFEIPVPNDAFSIDSDVRVVWSISLIGALGAVTVKDRWHALWVTPSVSYLTRLRDQPVASIEADSSATRSLWSRIKKGLVITFNIIPFVLACLILFAVAWQEPSALYILLSIVLIISCLVLYASYQARLSQALRRDLYLDRSAAQSHPSRLEEVVAGNQDEVALNPPAVPLRVEIFDLVDYAPQPGKANALGQPLSAAQRFITGRGAMGLAFLLIVNLAATILAEKALGFGLTFFGLCSVLVVLFGRGPESRGRPLSIYAGTAVVFTWCWLIISFYRAVGFSMEAETIRQFGAAALLCVGAVSLIWAARKLRRVFAPQLRLLVLWNFGQKARMQEIVTQLWQLWVYLGPIQFLRGPGLESDLHHIALFLKGGVREVVVNSASVLRRHYARFRYDRTAHGLYRRNNSLQCTDAVWREALHLMLDSSDLVLMDLTGFDEHNQGCAFEMDLLVDRVRTDCFVLLMDGTTDVSLVKQILEKSWSLMEMDSPNRDSLVAPIRLIRIPDTPLEGMALSNALSNMLLYGVPENASEVSPIPTI